ncbi:MAG TPA: hypothetical protein VEX11_08755, partial [Acetobacteraceae bacterium]|nr:hypothetical protein [Acetobacteraceae bacterium]
HARLRRIAALYAVEAEGLFAWLSAQLARLPGGSPTAKAIRYPLNHRDGLVRFVCVSVAPPCGDGGWWLMSLGWRTTRKRQRNS